MALAKKDLQLIKQVVEEVVETKLEEKFANYAN